MAVDECGCPIAVQLTGGEVHDAKYAPDLIKTLPTADYTIADKGYDSEEIRD
jgi:transposase